MKLAGEEQARAMYERIKASELYDPELGMYKTSVSLEEESDEIGRIRAFTAGWLERESVFLHMTYKYLLSLLKAGLYDEFFSEIRLSLIPFLDPQCMDEVRWRTPPLLQAASTRIPMSMDAVLWLGLADRRPNSSACGLR